MMMMTIEPTVETTVNEAQLVQADVMSHSRRDFLKLASTGLGALLAMGTTLAVPTLAQAKFLGAKTAEKRATMPAKLEAATLFDFVPAPVQAMDFTAVFARTQGFSAKQLEAHYGLYKGYVGKYKTITDAITALTPEQLQGANGTYHTYRELLVEQSFALNGVLLHEAYFEGLGGSETRTKPSALLRELLNHHFGSWEGFTTHLMAAGKCMRGWAILGVNQRDGGLHWYGLDSHNQFSPMLTIPILVVDVYEHAYLIDFSTNREAYLIALMQTIDWGVVEQRLALAMEQKPATLTKKR
jgi:superoxide dismutase, Fe-Mn family